MYGSAYSQILTVGRFVYVFPFIFSFNFTDRLLSAIFEWGPIILRSGQSGHLYIMAGSLQELYRKKHLKLQHLCRFKGPKQTLCIANEIREATKITPIYSVGRHLNQWCASAVKGLHFVTGDGEDIGMKSGDH